MKDDHKTKKQLIDELSELRSQNAELKKSESPEKYRSLVENIRDVIYELDDQGVVLYISPAVRDLLGYDSAEITGKNFIGLAHKDDQSSLTEWFSELRKGKESPFEYRIIDKSGEYKWAQTRVRPIMEGGQFKGARGILIDVTTQKRAEAALRESEDRYRELNDVLPISISTFEVDAAGTIISYNRTALETFRYNEDDYKEGMNALQFFAPEEWQRVGENMRGVTQGTSTPGQEFTFLRKDGSKFPGLIYASPNIHQDKTVGIRGVIMDITERKRTDAKLRQQADAMDAATDGIALLNAEGEYVYVNNAHAKCYGYENAGELIGKSWRVLYDSDVLQRFDQEIMPEFSRKGDWHGEAVGTKKNGAKFPQELSLTAMNNGGLICVVRDITERKRAEEQIYRANAFLDSIVENIPNMLFLKEAGSLRFVRFNRAGEDLLGYSRNDLLGKNDYDFFPKEQADHFTKKDREVLHGKEVVDIPEELLQTRNKGERTMHTKKVPLLDMNGEPEYLLGISEDITERKQAEKQLQDTLESLRKAVGTTI
ncbi:MAG: PAS domain S-box protein, partial [Smithellaceae bacterium]|nr:PAS domain S-box protein [Smithellaceae bacterium]